MVRIEKEILKELGKNRRETAGTRKETGHTVRQGQSGRGVEERNESDQSMKTPCFM